MDLATRDRVRELFEQGVLMPRELRRRWIDSHADDPAVAAEVRALFESDEQAGDFLAEPAPPPAGGAEDAPQLEEPPGTRIGAYALVRRIGEGGFGDVYLAEQAEPIRRRVALKLVKPGMDSRQVLARFDAERNALAMLEHPNVARVIDAGATQTGRPYFVMELVEGASVTAYCDAKRLMPAQRIELFISVCNAVQHAHQKGIIHRDLKPANVLVPEIDGRAVPKVIDFGVAKVLLGDGDDRPRASLVTAQAQRLGTPAYMSPEQAAGSPVDTRADVYGLGVTLYELLCGRLPWDLDSDHRADEPPPMARRVGESAVVALARGLPNPGALQRGLRGELDWIVGKCLRRDPDERYTTAAALADDLEAYLAKRPVVAAPPSRLYLLRKFVRRNHLLVAAIAVALLGLLTALILTHRALSRERAVVVREREALDRERRARESIQHVNNYIAGIFRSANPQFNSAWRRDFTVAEALDQMSAQLASEAAQLAIDAPLAAAELCYTLAQAYGSLGQPEKGMDLARRAIELRRQHLGEDHDETLNAIYALASTYTRLERYDEALALYRQTWEGTRRRHGDDHKDALTSAHGVGLALMRLRRFDEAEPMLRDAYERKRRHPAMGPDDESTSITANVLGRTLFELGRLAEAEELIREAYASRVRNFSADHPVPLGSQVSLVDVLNRQGEFDEAHELGRDALERARRVVGEDHSLTRTVAAALANVLDRQGRADEARALRARYARPTTQPTTAPATAPATHPPA